MANDPHRSFDLPSNRYLVHLLCPGYNVIGATYPHLPGVQIGHNERVAWGLTLTGPVNADLFVEETDPVDPERYRVGPDRWERMRRVSETITVKGEATPRTVTLRWTRHGPVLLEDRQRHRAVAVRWAVSEPGTAAYLAAPALGRANDVASFRQVLRHWRAPTQNFVFADVDGEIGFHVAGMIPLRADGSSGLLPYPGTNGERHEWTGFLPFAALPRVENPADGILVTANNNILPPEYTRPFSAVFRPPERARRIRQLLESWGNGLTVNDFARLQNDRLSPAFLRLRPTLEAMHTDDPQASWTRRTLLEWDGRMERDSAAAALFSMWVTILPGIVLPALEPATGAAEIPAGIAQAPYAQSRLTGPARVVDWGKNPEQRRDVVVARTLTAAWNLAVERLGPEPVAWQLGKVQAVSFVHPLSLLRGSEFDLPAVPKGGDMGTVDLFGIQPGAVGIGASFRQILDVSDWDNSRVVNAPGQSGQPSSPHYADLLPLWAEGNYFPLLFTRPAIEASGYSRVELAPADE